MKYLEKVLYTAARHPSGGVQWCETSICEANSDQRWERVFISPTFNSDTANRRPQKAERCEDLWVNESHKILGVTTVWKTNSPDHGLAHKMPTAACSRQQSMLKMPLLMSVQKSLHRTEGWFLSWYHYIPLDCFFSHSHFLRTRTVCWTSASPPPSPPPPNTS